MPESPCIKKCNKYGIYEGEAMCTTCGRLLSEIKGWRTFTDEQKQKILESIDIRLDQNPAESD
jgi:predicted Fe-S protein YdhL (DUF1289 family)